MKRTALVLATAAAIVAVPGVALAVPGEPGQCSGTGICQVDPRGNGNIGPYGYEDNSKHPSFWEYTRQASGYLIVHGLLSPLWPA